MDNTTYYEAARYQRTASKTPRVNYKRFPAYGKRILEMRLAGKVPDNSIVVTFDWNLGRIFHRIVITDDAPIGNLELNYLAGLDVILVYGDKDASRAMLLAQSILAAAPRSLTAFAIDIPKNLILKNLAGEVLI